MHSVLARATGLALVVCTSTLAAQHNQVADTRLVAYFLIIRCRKPQ